MPVVTTLFEFFLLLNSGNSVVNRFRTVQSRCFAHSQKRVYTPLWYGSKGWFGFWTATLCPPGVTLAHAVALVAIVCHTCVLLCCCVLICCCAMLCCCVYVYVCMCLCVCFFAFLRLFWQSFWLWLQKSQGLCGSFEVPFSWLFWCLRVIMYYQFDQKGGTIIKEKRRKVKWI